MAKKQYHFHPVTGEFRGVTDAHIDPVESRIAGRDVYSLSRNATFLKPKKVRKGFARVFADGGWVYAEDHRGLAVWRGWNDGYAIADLGPLPSDVQLTEPPEPPESPDVRAGRIASGVKAETARRIFAEADRNTQVSMNARICAIAGKVLLGGALTDADRVDLAAHIEAEAYIVSMKAASRSLASAGDDTFADDRHWPAPGAAARALVKRL